MKKNTFKLKKNKKWDNPPRFVYKVVSLYTQLFCFLKKKQLDHHRNSSYKIKMLIESNCIIKSKDRVVNHHIIKS